MAAAKLGMPNARPFSLKGKEKVFLVNRSDLVFATDRKQWSNCGLVWGKFALFENDEVFGFTEPELRRLAKTLRFLVVERYGSTNENAEWVGLTPRDELEGPLGKLPAGVDTFLAAQFEIGRWEGESPDAFAYQASRILGPVLKRKIMLDVPHNAACEYEERGAFTIHLYSTSSTLVKREKSPAHIWRTERDEYESVFWPNEGEVSGVRIFAGNYPVAEVLPNALYVHVDLTEYGERSDLRIFSRILREAKKILSNPKKFEQLLAAEKAAFAKKQEAAFAALIRKAIPLRDERTKAALAAARIETEAARVKLFQLSRAEFGLEESLNKQGGAEERILGDIQKLNEGKVAFVTGVTFGGDARRPILRAFTEEIIAFDRYSGRKYRLGRYEIVLDLDVNGGIRFFNLDRVLRGYHGPHINSEGYPCLGTIRHEIVQYLGHYEFEAAISLAVAYLQSPNSLDADGARVKEYPLYIEPTGESQ